MAGTTFSVTITLLNDTATKLATSGSKLYAFKVVRCSDLAGLPTVWSVTSRLMPTTTISWTSPYQGFSSASDVTAGTLITEGFATALAIGSTLVINSPTGIGTVQQNGTADACSIQNTTTTQFSCGLAQAPAGSSSAPICAFPLYGNNLVVITPLDQVLLMFSTLDLSPGTAITSLATAVELANLAVTTGGVVLDLTGVTQRAVSYDINLGWSWGGATWGKSVPSTASLTQWLILPD